MFSFLINEKMNYSFFVITLVLHIVYTCNEHRTACNERFFDRDSFVCVCDAEYCDVIGDVTLPFQGAYKRVISSRDKHRFSIFMGTEDASATGENIVKVNYDQEYQTMLGFGGAFSDSTGISITSLSKEAQENLMRSYFSDDGIEYSVCRIPIAGTDFSTHPYSYDEVENDIHLEHFALTKEDFLYKIPLIKKAMELSTRQIRLFGSPWSPPPWMKENGMHNGKGELLREMWNPFANYLIKFVEEYRNVNISLWGITTGNEPLAGFNDWPWNACAWSSEDMRDWIKTSFGPALESANLRYLKVMIHEHGRDHLLSYPTKILKDELARKYVDGVAVHWYTDFTHGPEVLSELQNEFKDKFLLYTEACLGFDGEMEDKVQMGSWGRAEIYASNIIENINHHSTGWIDWNMALNMEGGPNWANNVVDSPIIVNEERDEFYKQPMFYAMGHFSKFVTPGSKRLYTELEDTADHLQAAAFHDKEKDSFVIVILNKSDEKRKISLQTLSKKFINVELDPKSLETILFKSSAKPETGHTDL